MDIQVKPEGNGVSDLEEAIHTQTRGASEEGYRSRQTVEEQMALLCGHPSGLLPHIHMYTHREVAQHKHVKQAAFAQALMDTREAWNMAAPHI